MKKQLSDDMRQVERQFGCKTPCANCPFRKDGEGIGLNAGRLTNTIGAIASGEHGTFHCHKTIGYKHYEDRDYLSDDDGSLVADKDELMTRKHCAGAMAVSIMAGSMPLIMRMGIMHQMIKPDHYDEAMADVYTPEYIFENNL